MQELEPVIPEQTNLPPNLPSRLTPIRIQSKPTTTPSPPQTQKPSRLEVNTSVGQKRIDASVLEGKEFIAINSLPSKTDASILFCPTLVNTVPCIQRRLLNELDWEPESILQSYKNFYTMSCKLWRCVLESI